MKQIIVDFLKWDCKRRYGSSEGLEIGINKIADDYLQELETEHAKLSPDYCDMCKGPCTRKNISLPGDEDE